MCIWLWNRFCQWCPHVVDSRSSFLGACSDAPSTFCLFPSQQRYSHNRQSTNLNQFWNLQHWSGESSKIVQFAREKNVSNLGMCETKWIEWKAKENGSLYFTQEQRKKKLWRCWREDCFFTVRCCYLPILSPLFLILTTAPHTWSEFSNPSPTRQSIWNLQ